MLNKEHEKYKNVKPSASFVFQKDVEEDNNRKSQHQIVML